MTTSKTGDLINFGPSRGGLNREWSLLTKSSDKDFFGSLSVLFPIPCGINIQFSDSNT